MLFKVLVTSVNRMIRVDKEKCIGCGACVAVCSEGFELKNGKSSIKNEKARCIEEAVATCPVGAIIIE